VRCKTCHYSLANLTEHRCPECGASFDPNDPSTYFDASTTDRPRTLVGIATLSYGFLALIWLSYVYLIADSEPLTFGVALSIITGALALTALTFAAGVLVYSIYWLVRRAPSLAIVLVVVLVLVSLLTLMHR
jgi:hypothetical protein